MANESLQLLWRGGDIAKYSALQSALHNEGIKFYDAPVYDPAGGFLQSRPYYLDAMPGFEIRVMPEDFERALSALQWVESKESAIAPIGEAASRDLPFGESYGESSSRDRLYRDVAARDFASRDGVSRDLGPRDLVPRDQGPYELKPELPYNWDEKEATAEVWYGDDDLMADYLASVLAENGIPSNIPNDPGVRMRLCVRPVDLQRARTLVRGIVEEE